MLNLLTLLEVPLLPKLRGNFAEFLNEGSLARLRILSLPTCVGLRYGHPFSLLEAFLGSLGSATSVLVFPRRHISELCKTDLPVLPPTCLRVLNQRYASLTLLRPPFAQTANGWYWNFHQLSIAYAFRPRLRSRLTLGGRAFPRKP